jgi:hypothetical protein
MPRALSLRSLFLAWVCFSLTFSTVFEAFLTTFLIDSGYIRPIQNIDELYASGIKLAYSPEYNFIFENFDERKVSKFKTNLVKCRMDTECWEWTMIHKNVSVLVSDYWVEILVAIGGFLGENSEPLICSLEDGIIFSSGLSMIMFHGDLLMRRVSEIIDRLVQSGIYSQLDVPHIEYLKLISRKIGIFHPLDGYYSFNLSHMQPAFYLLFMGWCLSAFCFMIEVLYNRVFGQKS